MPRDGEIRFVRPVADGHRARFSWRASQEPPFDGVVEVELLMRYRLVDPAGVEPPSAVETACVIAQRTFELGGPSEAGELQRRLQAVERRLEMAPGGGLDPQCAGKLAQVVPWGPQAFQEAAAALLDLLRRR